MEASLNYLLAQLQHFAVNGYAPQLLPLLFPPPPPPPTHTPMQVPPLSLNFTGPITTIARPRLINQFLPVRAPPQIIPDPQFLIPPQQFPHPYFVAAPSFHAPLPFQPVPPFQPALSFPAPSLLLAPQNEGGAGHGGEIVSPPSSRPSEEGGPMPAAQMVPMGGEVIGAEEEEEERDEGETNHGQEEEIEVEGETVVVVPTPPSKRPSEEADPAVIVVVPAVVIVPASPREDLEAGPSGATSAAERALSPIAIAPATPIKMEPNEEQDDPAVAPPVSSMPSTSTAPLVSRIRRGRARGAPNARARVAPQHRRRVKEEEEEGQSSGQGPSSSSHQIKLEIEETDLSPAFFTRSRLRKKMGIKEEIKEEIIDSPSPSPPPKRRRRRAIKTEVVVKKEEPEAQDVIPDCIPQPLCCLQFLTGDDPLGWVQCDGCDKWLHPFCLGLGNTAQFPEAFSCCGPNAHENVGKALAGEFYGLLEAQYNDSRPLL